ncbi:MAG TPA: cyclic peptide export ABC transporter [Verrucomicrobiae bacterium]|nr:cyclic peptide export ABC transporter [Verrucomicrobiae bacterium]
MKLIKFLFQSCRQMLFLTTLAALLSGACNAGLIAMVNWGLNRNGAKLRDIAFWFVLLVMGKVASQLVSQGLLAKFAQRAISELRYKMIERILTVPLRKIEEIGSPAILVALTDDVFNIAQALLGVPITSVNVALVLGGAAYLGWLSWKLLAAMMVFMVLGAASYRILMGSAFRYLHLAREEESRLYRHFRSLSEGIKELKLHRNRRVNFLREHVLQSTEAFQKHNVAAEYRFVVAQNWNYVLLYILLGLLIFLLPRLQPVSTATLTGYVLTILYLMGPLAGVLGSFSLFGRAEVALEKVEKITGTLAACEAERDASPKPERKEVLEELELINVSHTYRTDTEDRDFVLGPLSLQFGPGELVFLVGGNGSGKSTLAKIITGLYFPESGEIRLNGKLVDHHNRDEYRQIFSAVFSDFYLFDSLLGLNGKDLDKQAREYIQELHLQRKVKVANGELSTTSLSQGQRKRLALLTAYLEDRPFYLFDEWASDQDPQFKKVFYTEILPELKSRGKTVLVITHDDQYFHLADRIIKLDYGQLVSGATQPSDFIGHCA